jgi:hypothetical protein
MFVSGTNLRPTEYSPVRLAASDGTDIGALAYAGDPSSSLQGVLFSNKTLTGANTLTGDLTVRPGVTLTLDPGATLTFATTDGLGSGADPAEVELIVNGTLAVQGTSASPASLTATGAYGVRILGTGSATFDYATINGGFYGVYSSGSSTFNNSTIQGATTVGLYTDGGNSTFNSGFIQSSNQAIVAAAGTTLLSLNYSQVRSSGSSASGLYAITLSAPANLIHNTITANNYGGVRVNSFTGTVNIYDNIVSSNGAYGINFGSATATSPTRVVHHNDVWSHSTANLINVSAGAGGISANPMFVSGTNLRPTEYSPVRLAASDGTDIGALAYAGDPSASLQGVLVANKTLTGANPLTGDLTVRPGVTLTLAAGASLTFASTDGLGSGADPAEVELIVNGTVAAQGTGASPVNITATGAWGVFVSSSGSATFDYATISGGFYGVYSSGSSTFNNSTIQGATTIGLYTDGGTNTFNNGTIQSSNQAVIAATGTTLLSLNYSLVRSSGSSASGLYAIALSAPANLVHNTITANNYGAIRVNSFTTGTVNIYDNIIATNGSYGLNFANTTSPARGVHHNDVWNHSVSNHANVSAGTGSISANPLFVSPTNFTLQETSPCRNIASDGTDLGAFPYAPVSVAYVVVTPSAHTMPVQGTHTFTATAYDAANNPLPGAIITWSASGAAGTISASGLFTAGCTPGTYAGAITATSEGKSASATVTLTTGPVATVTVSPSSTTLPINGTQAFTATARDGCGNTLPSAPISWLVTAGGGTISSGGVFTAGSTPGTFTNTVRATSGSIFGTASVTVSGGALASIEVSPSTSTLTINGTQTFTATGKDASGNPVPVTVTWSVVNGGGSISPTGVFTAGTTPGTYTGTVRATSGAISGSASVIVQPGALASIVVDPNTANLPINATQMFTAMGKDSAGNTVPVTVTWSVTSGGGTINSSGLFTAGTVAGTYVNTVRATSGAISGFASVTVDPGSLATITVSPSTATLPINGAQTFTATGKDSAGNTVPTTVTWSTVNGGGTISPTGVFTAGSTPGTYANTVRATSGAISGFASVTVQPGALASIEVSPSTATLPINGTQTFTATGKDASGNPVPVTVTWSVANGGGTISTGGVFTAGTTPGTYANTVRATSGAISGFASVTVNSGSLASIEVSPSTASLGVNGTQLFTATGKDASGNPVPVTVTWSVVNGGGTISSGGLFTAGSTIGTFTNTVRATSGAISGFASVSVNPGSLASIEVSPSTTTLPINGTQTFTATGKDASGNPVPVTVTWSVVSGGGTISSGGLFTAGTTPGTYANTVRATSGAISGFASVTVQPGALASIEVSPSTATLPITEAQTFTATGKDSAGNPVPVTITWSVVNGGGTIDGSGVFTAGSTPGTYANTVRATSGAISGFASVTVQPGALASIEVSPSTTTLPINGTQTFTATGKDSAGNPVPVTVTWSVVSGGGAISSGGLFTAGTTPGTYANTVRATSGTLSGFASVTVQPGALASVEVSPASATLEINGTQTFTATGKDSAGNPVPVTITWSVVNGGGSISSGGLFTAGTAAGTFTQTVRATSGALFGTATVTVNPGAIDTVAVSPASATLGVLGTRRFTATAKDAWGNTVPGTPTWSVSPATAGSIDATGLFTAGGTEGSYPGAVTARIGGVNGSADVTITASTLAKIVVTPALVNSEPRGVHSFTAKGEDADGNTIPISVTWSVLKGAGTITSAGVFTATMVPGTYLDSVVATADGITGTASVIVAPGGVQRVVISPLDPTVVVRGTVAFTAKAFDAFDNEISGLTPRWEVVNGGGTIDAAGVFTAGRRSGLFTNTVKATMDTKSATTSVRVASDFDGDGMSDEWEIDNGLDPNSPDDGSRDADSDKLTNVAEFAAGTLPNDADTDDDGVIDGNELRPTEDADGDGLPNARDPDSDNDNLFDGTEMAVSSRPAATDASKNSFIADADPETSTDPLTADTDGDGLKDGAEDANRNGRVDQNETDPNKPDTRCSATPECGSGNVCQSGVCVADPSTPDEGGGGCGCNGSAGAGASVFGLLLLSLLGRVGARRRRA